MRILALVTVLATITAQATGAQATAASVEQLSHGTRASAELVASFDGLGDGFVGPQGGAGTARYRNPSDNSIAVGPNHVVQIVNSRMAIFTKQGKVLYGPVPTNNVFRGHGGPCERQNNGDAVVRYDQLADRWLIVMPIFSRQRPGLHPGIAGPAVRLYEPLLSLSPIQLVRVLRCRPFPPRIRTPCATPSPPGRTRSAPTIDTSSLASCSRTILVPLSGRMLRGEPAAEQCIVVEDANFLNNADLEGRGSSPTRRPHAARARARRGRSVADHDAALGGLQPDRRRPE